MGLFTVLNGIGKGSIMGYGRVFGVHNPFDVDISKARDPFIRLATLRRLSTHSNAEVRAAVAENIAQRLRRSDFTSVPRGFASIEMEIFTHPKIPSLYVAREIHGKTPKSKETQTGRFTEGTSGKYQQMTAEQMEQAACSGVDLAHSPWTIWVEGSPPEEIIEHDYEVKDLDFAFSRLEKFSPTKRQRILHALSLINEHLATLIIEHAPFEIAKKV